MTFIYHKNTSRRRRAQSGVTLIELVVCMALIAVLSLLLLRVFTPIKNILTADQTRLKNYVQVLYIAELLDTLVRLSESIIIGDGQISFAKNGATTICLLRGREFGCQFNLPSNTVQEQVTSLESQYPKFIPLFQVASSSTLLISRGTWQFPIYIEIGEFRIQFGLFPQVSLI